MARGRARNQQGRVTLTSRGSWQISYYVYLTDAATNKPKRHHRARIVGRKPSMRKVDAEEILRQELRIIGSSPTSRPADGTMTFGEWMRTVYIPMRGANWRDATVRSNHDYLDRYIYPVFGCVALNDITKSSVQMLLNKMANEGYSYWVVYHVRDLIKAGLAEAVDQDVLEKNVARKTVVPEIEERDKNVLPIEMYGQLLARIEDVRDRAIFLIGCFCALRPSELFALTWESCQGSVFKVMNTAWRGQFQPKKIKRKNRYGGSNFRWVAIPDIVQEAIEQWRRQAKNTAPDALMFPAEKRAQFLGPKPMLADNWARLRLYPIAKQLGMKFRPSFQVLRRSFSTHGKSNGHPTDMQAQLGHTDPRTTLDFYTRTLGPEVLAMVNQIANQILGLGRKDAGSIQ